MNPQRLEDSWWHEYSDPDEPRRFKLVRIHDESGISGIGIVAYGVEFCDGKVAMRWNTNTASTAFFDCPEDVIAIHGHSGNTVIMYID